MCVTTSNPVSKKSFYSFKSIVCHRMSGIYHMLFPCTAFSQQCQFSKLTFPGLGQQYLCRVAIESCHLPLAMTHPWAVRQRWPEFDIHAFYSPVISYMSMECIFFFHPNHQMYTEKLHLTDFPVKTYIELNIFPCLIDL